MKPHERRQTRNYPYYKLATWDARSFTFRDGKIAYDTKDAALADILKPGKYRVSIVTATGRSDEAPINVVKQPLGDLTFA
jgi:hypothetical protein